MRPAYMYIYFLNKFHTVCIPIINVSLLLISFFFFLCICFVSFRFVLCAFLWLLFIICSKFEWSQPKWTRCVRVSLWRDHWIRICKYHIIHDGFGGETIMRILFYIYSTPLSYYCGMALPHICMYTATKWLKIKTAVRSKIKAKAKKGVRNMVQIIIV